MLKNAPLPPVAKPQQVPGSVDGVAGTNFDSLRPRWMTFLNILQEINSI
jgi:hypothetical protein